MAAPRVPNPRPPFSCRVAGPTEPGHEGVFGAPGSTVTMGQAARDGSGNPGDHRGIEISSKGPVGQSHLVTFGPGLRMRSDS